MLGHYNTQRTSRDFLSAAMGFTISRPYADIEDNILKLEGDTSQKLWGAVCLKIALFCLIDKLQSKFINLYTDL